MTKKFIIQIHSNSTELDEIANVTALSQYLKSLTEGFKELQETVQSEKTEHDAIKQLEKNIKNIVLHFSPVFDRAEFGEKGLGLGYRSDHDLLQSASKQAIDALYAEFLSDSANEISTQEPCYFSKSGERFQEYKKANQLKITELVEENLRNSYLKQAEYLIQTTIALHADSLQKEFFAIRGLPSALKEEIKDKLAQFHIKKGFLSYFSFFNKPNESNEKAQLIDFTEICKNFMTAITESVRSIHQSVNNITNPVFKTIN